MDQFSAGLAFWSAPAAMMSRTAAAGGIALINTPGNLGGFLVPYLHGLIEEATGSSFTRAF